MTQELRGFDGFEAACAYAGAGGPSAVVAPAYASLTFEGFSLPTAAEDRLANALDEAQYDSAVMVLQGNLRDIDDRYTLEHCDRVGVLNGSVAALLGCDDETIRDAVVSGKLHDVGKYYLQHIIHIDGKLTDEQFKAVKPHVLYGAHLVSAAGKTQRVVRSVGNHHAYQADAYPAYPEAVYDVGQIGALSPEHIIGTGLALADVYDAMRSGRPGRAKPLPMEAALEAVDAMPVSPIVRGAFRELFAAAVAITAPEQPVAA